MSDTVGYYNRNAAQYVADTANIDLSALRERFLAQIPNGGLILDAGCGSGRDSIAFRQQGYRVRAFDAATEIARRAAERIGQPVQVQRFEDIDERAAYDGIWACASLLHLPSAEIRNALQRLWAALRPGGMLYLSLKHGEGERVDVEGRHFTDATEVRLRDWLATLHDERAEIDCWLTTDVRPHRSETWLNALVRRSTTPANKLVTGERTNPFLPQLCDAIASADEIDLAVSFIKVTGLRMLLPDLHATLGQTDDASRRPARVRIVTSDYLDVTDPEALRLLRLLQERGAQTRVFHVVGGGFHLKAYLFARFGGNHHVHGTAFIGSSNISRQALTDGLEWNYRIEYPGDDGFLEARARFEEIFRDPRTVSLSDEWIDAYEQRRIPPPRAVASGSLETEPPPAPTPIQSEALAALKATRLAGYRRGLVVLATGLGKTWLAAFDAEHMRAARVLFVAHREEILSQAAETFARIRRDSRIGFYRGEVHDTRVDVLCASIQTLGKSAHLERFAANHFDYLVIDEFHHAAARTYRRLLAHFEPRFLLGLTATPERTDQSDILSLCDDNLVFDRDLCAGIEAGLLAPFHYFGIRDDSVDYRDIPWRNGRFDPLDLSSKLATRARARQVLAQWLNRSQQRTVAFCVSIRHADFMAEQFQREGIAAAAVHARSDLGRSQALQRLGDGRLQVIFSVDLFNEGVDLPSVDTILMLRPTESKILFLQQLGRGLRKAAGKTHVAVLDFVGNHRVFLDRVKLLLSFARSHVSLDRFLDDPKPPALPAGCWLNYDLEAIDLLRSLMPRGVGTVERVYREFVFTHDRRPAIGEFYRMGYAPSVLRNTHRSWFDFVASEGQLSEAERHCLEHARDWFDALETTALTKSYKMILLKALIEADALTSGLALRTLGARSHAILDRSPEFRRDLDGVQDVPDPRNPDPDAWLAYWNRNPVAAWCRPARAHPAYFRTEQDRLIPDLPIPQACADTFVDMTRELVDYRLAQYRRRLQGDVTGEAFHCKLTWNQRDPILKLPARRTHPLVPEGETDVTLPTGEVWTFRLMKEYCNVARPAGTARNQLPDLLRRWFGLAGGRPGTAFQVRFFRSPGGWQIEPLGQLIEFPAVDMITAYASLRAAAGALLEPMAVNSVADQVALPIEGDTEKLFALRATGDSMAGGDDPIHDGDWVVFRHARDITLKEIEGKVALLQTEHAEDVGLQIKRVLREDGRWMLQSDNPARPSIAATSRSVPIATRIQHFRPEDLAPPLATALDAEELDARFGMPAPAATGRVRGHLFIVLGGEIRLETPGELRFAHYDRRPAETAFVLAPNPKGYAWRYCGVARQSPNPPLWTLPEVDYATWRAFGKGSSVSRELEPEAEAKARELVKWVLAQATDNAWMDLDGKRCRVAGEAPKGGVQIDGGDDGFARRTVSLSDIGWALLAADDARQNGGLLDEGRVNRLRYLEGTPRKSTRWIDTDWALMFVRLFARAMMPVRGRQPPQPPLTVPSEHGRGQQDGDEGGDAQATDDRRGQLNPKLPRRRTEVHIAAKEVDRQPQHHGHQPHDSGHGGQQHRAQTLSACPQRRVCRGKAAGAILVVGVDQHDVVVHHNAGQRHDADATHDHGKRLLPDQQAQQHACDREEDGREDQRPLKKAVELSQQHQKHEQDRDGKRQHQEGHGLLLIFQLTGNPNLHLFPQPGRSDGPLKHHEFIRDRGAGGDARGDGLHVATIDPVDHRRCRCGPEIDEIADRDQAARSGDAQFGQLREIALLDRIAQADIDLLVCELGQIGAEPQASGQQLHGVAQRIDVNPVARRLLSVDLQSQFRLQHRHVTGDVHERTLLLHQCLQLHGGSRQPLALR
jgi:superfamily II DNA or RNA helicase/SAM-dependent methyltransferase